MRRPCERERPRRRGAAALALAALALACAPKAAPRETAPAPSPRPAPSAARRAPEPVPPPCERVARLDVHKRERRLVARCERGAEVVLAIALGHEPAGPKREAGDRRTPEGRYRVRGPAVPSRFHRFLPIDYPSVADAEAAYGEERIGKAERRRIRKAHEAGSVPPADTPLGGAIGLHGEGERWRGATPGLDWTHGCIGLSDAGIDFLAARVPSGTPIAIHPERASDPRAKGAPAPPRAPVKAAR